MINRKERSQDNFSAISWLSSMLLVSFIAVSSCKSDKSEPFITRTPTSSSSSQIREQQKAADSIVKTAVILTDTTVIKQATDLTQPKKSEETKTPLKLPTKPVARKVKVPKINFEIIRHDFDTIDQGDIVEFDFVFTNKGTAPLVINTVNVTCGCTQPSYPFIPIAPGEKGFVGVTYNSVGKEGLQRPLITVSSNGSAEPINLMLSGFVQKPKKEKEENSQTDSLEQAIDTISGK